MAWRIMTSYVDYLYQMHTLMRDPLYRGVGVPHGNSEPILLIPGFLAGDWSLFILGEWLNRLGYRVYYSGIDCNISCPQKTSTLLRWRLEYVAAETQQPVTIIGHSLGGVLARFLAASVSQQVRQVITLGSPIDGSMRIHSLVPLTFKILQHVQGFSQRPLPLPPCAKDVQCSCDFVKGAFASLLPEVRFTTIYSKQDEIVEWQACIDTAKVNYEVQGQHLGLIVNPAVYRLLGQLLVSQAPAGQDSFRKDSQIPVRDYLPSPPSAIA